MSHVEKKKKNITEEELGERQEYLRLRRERGTGREVTQGIHSFVVIMVPFLRLTLQMSCGESRQQIKAETYHKAYGSSQPISTISQERYCCS